MFNRYFSLAGLMAFIFGDFANGFGRVAAEAEFCRQLDYMTARRPIPQRWPTYPPFPI